MMLNNKYIFLTLKSIETEFLYSDFNKLQNCQLIAINRGNYINRITRKIVKKYTEKGWFGFFVRTLTKRIVCEQVVNRLFYVEQNRYVFIIYARVYESLGKTLVDEIRKKIPNAVLCVYFADLQKNFAINLSAYKRDFDYLFSFDKKQAELYHLNYLLEPFSYKPMHESEIVPIYDITYVGRVKNDMKRHNAVMKVYQQCKEKGLKCDFHIVDVPKQLQLDCEDIEYNQFMSFEDVMKHVIQSHAVLEILQTDEYSPTTRYSEACLYNRNIITNCEGIKDGFYKKDRNIYILDDSFQIDTEWITKNHKIDSDSYKKIFSIEKFIASIENVLNKKKN